MQERRRYHPADSGNWQWSRLLAFAMERADSYECAVPYPIVVQDLQRAPLWPRPLQALRGEVIDRHVSTIRWELAQDYATQFVRFRLTSDLRAYICSIRRLEEWSWRLGTPEDPTFYHGEALLLATESVQGRISVYADPEELAALTGVGIRLLEPLGVKAEPWPTP